ncbi:MAG TPA: protein kinase [Caldimonas sp.]|jgi:hypothetical protein|nr:protein kinase [Caldimonas sp.]HEX2541917.1 protein kinase [Caldimonas sp.]
MSTLPPDSAKPAASPSGTEHDALPPGTRFGEFEIIRVLGVGGFGIVYLAKDHSLERDVALKEYMPASLAARGLGPQITVRSSAFAETYAIGLRSFVNEARLLARFDHPSLVKVYRFWEDNATAYMVMPYLQGTTLRDTRRAMAHPPNEAWIRSVIAPILSALELLHREGVYHRDIAPDNILLPHDGPPVLLDFGAARRVISDRTQSLTAILKPSYAPIEQYAEMAQMRQGPWTDLYALGAVIHYLLFGAPPAPATARAVQDDAESIESRIVPGVSPLFLEAVSWMLSLRPNQRPQNGEQLRAVLDGSASVPPRGRPGITIPGALAPAAAGAFEPTRLVDGADAGRVHAARAGAPLPTQVAAHDAAAAGGTFSPTTSMPTARHTAPRADAALTDPARRTAPPIGSAPSPAPASTTVPPGQAQTPGSAWRPSRPATLPPPVPPAQARPAAAQTHPPPAATATRPQGLGPAAAVAPASVSRSGSPMRWLALGAGGVAVIVVAAVGGWQFARQQAPAAVETAASSAAPGIATMPATTKVPAAAPVSVAVQVPPAVQRPAPLPTTSPTVTAAPAAVPASPSTVTAAPAAVPASPSVTGAPAAATATAAPRPVPVPPAPTTLAAPSTAGSPSRIAVESLPPPKADSSSRTSVARTAASAPVLRPPGRPVPQALPDAGATATYVPPVRQAAPPVYGGGAMAPSYGGGSTAPAYGSGSAAPAYGSEPARPYGQVESREPAAARPVAVAETLAATPREACGKRVFIALAVCMDEKCEEPRFRQTKECVAVLARKAARENR